MKTADPPAAGMPATLQPLRMEALTVAETTPHFNEPPDPDGRAFCETPTARAILRVANWCHEKREMGLIVGEPGVGKTTALRHYEATHSAVHYISMNATLRTLSAALTYICQKLGHYAGGRARENYDIIGGHLQPQGGARVLLILDEAQHINDEVLDTIRCIHDEHPAGIVFCGNKAFRTRFNNERAGFGQVSSRVGIRLDLKRPEIEDVAAICDARGIRQPAAREYLFERAQSSGGLRTVGKLIDNAMEPLDAGEQITAKHLARASLLRGGRA